MNWEKKAAKEKMLELRAEIDATERGSAEAEKLSDQLMEPIAQAEKERGFPSSRTFPSKYVGVCAFSGERIWKMDPVRRVEGGNMEAPCYVHDRFVNQACDPSWRKLDGSDFELERMRDNWGFITVGKNGIEKGWIRRGDRIIPWRSWGKGKSAAQFNQVWRAAVAVRITGKATEND